MTEPVLIYADPFGGGHHPEYLAFFMPVCAALGIALHAYVPRAVWDGAVALAGDGAKGASLARDVNLDGSGLSERLRFLEDVERDAASAPVFFAMADPFMAALAVRALTGRRFSPRWSGIIFRDSYNFPEDERGRPLAQVKSFVKLAALRTATQRGVKSLLALNPMWRMKLPVPVVWLPDALSVLDRQTTVSAATAWPVPKPSSSDGRIHFLFFGVIAERKGLAEFCEGLLALTDDELQRIALRVLGRLDVSPAYGERLRTVVAALTRRGAVIEITGKHASESELDEALRASDIVLAPYRDHIGSSGIVKLAARYGRPLIAQSRYQIGAEVREHDLGLIITDDKDAVANAVRIALNNMPLPGPKMARYCADHDPEKSRDVTRQILSGLVLEHRS